MTYITEQHIKECATTVLHTAYEKLSYNPNARLATELILDAISFLSGFQIVTRVIPKDAMSELRGMLLTFERGQDFQSYLSKKVNNPQFDTNSIKNDAPVALIFISGANNQCWLRFTLIKEVAHLVLEQKDLLSSTRVSHLVEAVVKSSAFSKENILVNREDAGVKAAVEIFMPESLKDWAFNQINVRNNGPLQIAQHLMIPQKFVEQRLLEWGLPLTAPKLSNI